VTIQFKKTGDEKSFSDHVSHLSLLDLYNDFPNLPKDIHPEVSKCKVCRNVGKTFNNRRHSVLKGKVGQQTPATKMSRKEFKLIVNVILCYLRQE
jgi:hypothetical protein